MVCGSSRSLLFLGGDGGVYKLFLHYAVVCHWDNELHLHRKVDSINESERFSSLIYVKLCCPWSAKSNKNNKKNNNFGLLHI